MKKREGLAIGMEIESTLQKYAYVNLPIWMKRALETIVEDLKGERKDD